jgi:hypothetical protein
MANAYKVLGQVAPSATTDTTAYTVPSATEAVISTIVIANRAASAGTYRIAVRPNGATIANEHYLAYDIAIAANDSTALTLGITIDATDVVTVYTSSADMSFNLFGSEITA